MTAPWPAALGLALMLALALLPGCETPARTPLTREDMQPYSGITLRPGDAIKIAFPGAPSLNTTQQIRNDGKIELGHVGELTAAGRSPAELEKEILGLYGAQLVVKEVMVTVEVSAYPVYVTGAVLKPGKLMATHPMTVLESVMEAGGFDERRAKPDAVRVIRNENGTQKYYIVDVQAVLDGKSSLNFYLRPSDVVYVPERAF